MIAAILERPLIAGEDIAQATGAVSDTPVVNLCRQAGWSNKDYVTETEIQQVDQTKFFSSEVPQEAKDSITDFTNFRHFINVDIDNDRYSFSSYPNLTTLVFPKNIKHIQSETLYDGTGDGIQQLSIPDGCHLQNNVYVKGLTTLTLEGRAVFDGARIFRGITTLATVHLSQPVESFGYTNFYRCSITSPKYKDGSQEAQYLYESPDHIGGGSFIGSIRPEADKPLISKDDNMVVISSADIDFNKYNGIASYWSEAFESIEQVSVTGIDHAFQLQANSLDRIKILNLDAQSTLDNIDFLNGSLSGYTIYLGGKELQELIQNKQVYYYFTNNDAYIANDSSTVGPVLIYKKAADNIDLSDKDIRAIRQGALVSVRGDDDRIQQSIKTLVLPDTVRYLANGCIEADTVTWTYGNRENAVRYYGCTSIARKIPADIYGYETSQWIFEDAYRLCNTDEQAQLKKDLYGDKNTPLTLVMINASAVTDHKYVVADNVQLVLDTFTYCDEVYIIDFNNAESRSFSDYKRNKRIYYRQPAGVNLNINTVYMPEEIVLPDVDYIEDTQGTDNKTLFLSKLCAGYSTAWNDRKVYYGNRGKTKVYVKDDQYDNINKYWFSDTELFEVKKMSEMISDEEYIKNHNSKE